MPDLQGVDPTSAQAKLRALGFDAAAVAVQVIQDQGCASRVVCRTNPEALQRAGIHSTAILYVGE